MTIQRITVKPESGYKQYIIEELFIGRKCRRWQCVESISIDYPWEVPAHIQKRDPLKKGTYQFYTVKSDGFIYPALIGKGWFNSQGEEKPDPVIIYPRYLHV